MNHYFGSRKQLVQACIDYTYDEIRALRTEMEQLIAGGGLSAAVAEDAVRVGFRFAREHRVTARIMLRRAVESGSLEARRTSDHLLPFLGLFAVLLGGQLGLSGQTVRLRLQSLIFLAVRYAVCTDQELATIADVVVGRAAEAVEDHLVETLHALLPFPEPCRE